MSEQINPAESMYFGNAEDAEDVKDIKDVGSLKAHYPTRFCKKKKTRGVNPLVCHKIIVSSGVF